MNNNNNKLQEKQETHVVVFPLGFQKKDLYPICLQLKYHGKYCPNIGDALENLLYSFLPNVPFRPPIPPETFRK